ncbi:MAG: hypothetical protein AABY22_10885 [Nanoarchaeota archaeon]
MKISNELFRQMAEYYIIRRYESMFRKSKTGFGWWWSLEKAIEGKIPKHSKYLKAYEGQVEDLQVITVVGKPTLHFVMRKHEI